MPLPQNRQAAKYPGLLAAVVALLKRADIARIGRICSGSQSVAMDQDYNGWEKGTDKKSQIRSFS
jgi:hypothetical protein